MMLGTIRMAGAVGAVALGLVVASAAQGAATLATDPAGMAGFTGSQTLTNGPLSATLDYAVFAPASYPAAEDPSHGSNYVYAYQITGAGADAVTSFSVGLIPGSGATDAGADALHVMTGGVAPSTTPTLTSSSFRANFDFIEIGLGQWSQVLLFSSPNGPTRGPASIGNGGYNLSFSNIPTPAVPEPATVGLVGLAAAAGLMRRVRRTHA